jgi:photosynthetic reaction center H subunit
MTDGNIVGTIDVAELALYGFFLFFIMLVFWLRREDRREGYPLEDELTGQVETEGGPLSTATPKAFKLPFDKGTVHMPVPRTEGREDVEIAARRIEPFGGSPYEPTGNPLVDGVGPASYAQRAKWPDIDAHGRPRIVPMSADDEISIAPASTDPRGLPVIAADGEVAGTVTDLWVDRAEHMIRYLAVKNGRKTVLAPMAMATVSRDAVKLDAINAADYANAPKVKGKAEITRDEEERIVAYFGGGYLYANEERQEPLA